MHRRSSQAPEGVLSERILLIILILGLFLGCAVVPPVPVELHKFAGGEDSINLTFSGAESQPFDLNISKYTVVGNYSEPPAGGVINEFSFWACPYENAGSNVSNLTMHWPTGGSTQFFAGTLDSCQRLYVDPSEFNNYLAAKSATPFFEWAQAALSGSPPALEDMSFLMLKNPRMHHYTESVDYQFAIPYSPISIMASILNQTIPEDYQVYENSRIMGLRYTCFAGDQLKTIYGPTRSWNVTLAMPPMNISGIGISINETASATGVFSLFEFPCPAYGSPGKYRAEVRSLYVRVTNYTGWIPDSVFYDDFNSSSIDPAWDIRTINGAGSASAFNNYTNSKIDLRSNSADNDSAILMYYSTPITPPADNSSAVYIEVSSNTGDTKTVEGSFVGLFLFNETIDPGTNATVNSSIRARFVHNETGWEAYCPDAFPPSPNASGTFLILGQTHSFEIVMLNGTMLYLLDDFPVLSNCTPLTEDVYVAFSPDPITDLWNGDMSIDYVQIIDADYVTDYNATQWMDMQLLPLGGRSQADVLVCDCPEQYGRTFQFNISSDSPGILELSGINISYDALISYDSDGVAPTSTIENSSFSWVAFNSRVSNSEVEFQTGLYNSTVDDSEVMFSSLHCTNVTDSTLVMAFMVDPAALGLGWEIPCANRISNSEINFAIMFGGSVINSTVKGIPIIAFTDFENANVENRTLYAGMMVLNGTRYPGILVGDVDIGGLFAFAGFQGALPIACSENAYFSFDSVANLSLGNLDPGEIDCRFIVQNTWVNFYNLTFTNEFGGVRASLSQSNLTVRDMPGPINVTVYGGDTDIVFWNLDTNVLGEVTFYSEDMDIENGFASMNGSAKGGMIGNIVNNTRTSLIFYNIDYFDGHITYYENFTSNRTEALIRGTECPTTTCTNIVYNGATNTLMFDVANFSTYLINNSLTPPPGGGGDRDLSVSVSGECIGSPVSFNATSGASRVSGIDITLYYPVSGVSHIHTGTGGTANFTPSQEGTYSFSAYLSGYRQVDGTFAVEECAPPVPPVQNETIPPAPPAEEPPEEGTGGTITPEQPPAQPPTEIEVPSQPPSGEEVAPLSVQPESETVLPAPQCCLLFCAQLFGICWYWWLLIIILIIAGAYQLSKSLAK